MVEPAAEGKPPLPNFIVIGAFKGATTGLSRRLSEHPDIFMAPVKETHFFAEDDLYRNGTEGYREYFAAHSSESAIGEASPTYTRSKRYPHACERLIAAVPDVKLIYILRDPIARMESHWIEARRGGWPVPPFNQAVFSPNTDILASSLYWKELGLYRRHFEDDQILVLFTEDFHNQPGEILRQCYEFLEVDADYVNPGLGNIERPSSGAYVDRDWVARYVRSGPGKIIASMIPRGVLNLLRPIARTKVSSRPVWDAEVLSRSVELVRDDARQVLEYAGKPPDFWKLEKGRAVQ